METYSNQSKQEMNKFTSAADLGPANSSPEETDLHRDCYPAVIRIIENQGSDKDRQLLHQLENRNKQ